MFRRFQNLRNPKRYLIDTQKEEGRTNTVILPAVEASLFEMQTTIVDGW